LVCKAVFGVDEANEMPRLKIVCLFIDVGELMMFLYVTSGEDKTRDSVLRERVLVIGMT
jgi:hypothetical protein